MATEARSPRARTAWLWAVLPLALLAALVAAFLAGEPLAPLGVSAPPVEEITVERVVLDEAGMHVTIRADGSEPFRVAQVLVDGAYWSFEQDPNGRLGRLQRARIDVPYPWVEGEAHHLTFITGSGATFEHTVEVATATPRADPRRMLAFGLLGLYVGVVPVSLGLLFFPYLRTLGDRGIRFLLALTLGLLAFLLIDTLQEGLELGAGAAPALQGEAVVWLAALLTFLGLLAIGRRSGPPQGRALAGFLALGIGLHNLGEGLAIGAAYAIGEAALGSFLVVGFTLHNLTEGIGIAAPLARSRPHWATFVGLAALAGLPAVAGTWLGAFAFSPHWAALFLGVGAGAIAQVLVEVGGYLQRRAGDGARPWLGAHTLAGVALGIAVMYVTALLVSA